MNNERLHKVDDMSDEIKWILREKENYVVQKKRLDQQKFRRKIAKIVFPCLNLSDEIEMEGEGTEDIEL